MKLLLIVYVIYQVLFGIMFYLTGIGNEIYKYSFKEGIEYYLSLFEDPLNEKNGVVGAAMLIVLLSVSIIGVVEALFLYCINFILVQAYRKVTRKHVA